MYFELTQTLNSRGNEDVELFGTRLSFDKDVLAVTAKNADSKSKTTFDTTDGVAQTTFDNNFTTYAKKYIDTGVVYLYEKISDSLVYGQTLSYNELTDSTQQVSNSDITNSVKDFGLNLYANNNHSQYFFYSNVY